MDSPGAPPCCYLDEDEITAFLDDLDRNGDGVIQYAEVESALDRVHDELVPEPLPHNLLNNHDHANSRRAAAARHAFLRSIVGGDNNNIPRAQFAARVRAWQIPSLRHAQQDASGHRALLARMSVWRRVRAYWAVRGPEIVFVALVVGLQLAFGAWQMVKYLTAPQFTAAFGWGVVLAKACAGALYPSVCFLLLSMSRYLSTFLRQSYHLSRFINWDLSQDFHVRMAVATLGLSTLHAVGHLAGSFYWGSRPAHHAAVQQVLGKSAAVHHPYAYRDYAASLPGWTGFAALALFYLLSLLSLPAVRRWRYEVFQLAHLLMYPIVGLLIAHGTAHLLQWTMLAYFLPFPAVFIAAERLTRLVLGCFLRLPARLKVLDPETVELRIAIPPVRVSSYRPGQYVLLQVPALSFFQWHPFTVSTCLGSHMWLHIKTDGNWTRRLRALALAADADGGSATADIKVGLNGPFGAPAQRFYHFSHAIVAGSGIGVTPFSGILADLQVRDNRAHGGPDGFKYEQQLHPRRASRPWAVVADDNDSTTSSNSSSNNSDSDPDVEQERRRKRLAEKHYSIEMSQPAPLRRRRRGFHAYAHDYRRVDFHWMVRDRNHLLWFSDLLNAVSRSQVWHREHDVAAHLDVHMHTYVTERRADIATHVYRWLLEKHRLAGHAESLLTGLINPTHFGRPDFVRILDAHYDEMKAFLAAGGAAKSDRDRDGSGSPSRSGRSSCDALKVGVFFCGAPVIGEILADLCRLMTARGRADGTNIEYHFMMEVFG